LSSFDPREATSEGSSRIQRPEGERDERGEQDEQDERD